MYRVSGATIMHVGASVCMSVGEMQVKGTYGILTFFSLLLLILTWGYQPDTRGIGGYPSCQMLIISDISRVFF